MLDAVTAGERVTLTVKGEPTADIVPTEGAAAGCRAAASASNFATDPADPRLREDLDEIAGQTLDEL